MYPLDIIFDDLCVSYGTSINIVFKSTVQGVWIELFWNIKKILQMAE